MSKGSKRRQRSPGVSREKFARRWDRALKGRKLPRCSVCGRMHKPQCKKSPFLVAVDNEVMDRIDAANRSFTKMMYETYRSSPVR